MKESIESRVELINNNIEAGVFDAKRYADELKELENELENEESEARFWELEESATYGRNW